jgi:elongation factor P
MPLTDQPVKGMYIRIEDKVYYLLDRKLKTQGRQGGLIIMKMKSLENGKVLSKTIKAGVKIEQIIPETKEVQYSYADDESCYFMDTGTYEMISISKEVLGNYSNFLKEGEVILIMFDDDKVLTIRENPTVKLEVIEATDSVRGNTANNVTKTVELETGYKVNVPLFIKKGDILIINTESGEYTSRAQ